MLQAVHKAGIDASSATIGAEREQFIALFLAEVMPPPFRLGTGDAVDAAGHRTGQLDIVLEYPFLPSFPTPGTTPRVYLAESIAAVIEVKSNIETQWENVLATARKVAELKPDINHRLRSGTGCTADPSKIPFLGVGYEGWKTVATASAKLSDGLVDGILVIDPGIFVGRRETFAGIEAMSTAGPESLWWFIWCLHRATRVLNSPWDVSLPNGYAR